MLITKEEQTLICVRPVLYRFVSYANENNPVLVNCLSVKRLKMKKYSVSAGHIYGVRKVFEWLDTFIEKSLLCHLAFSIRIITEEL